MIIEPTDRFNDGPERRPEHNTNSRLDDIIIDGSFSVIYGGCLLAVIIIAVRNFKRYPQMVTQPNILVVVCLGMTLLSKFKEFNGDKFNISCIDRMICLLYSIFVDHNQQVEPDTIKSFFYFELPFWYINMATIVHFFEW